MWAVVVPTAMSQAPPWLERRARGGPLRRALARGRRRGPRLGPRPRHRRDVLRPADRHGLDPERDRGRGAPLPEPGLETLAANTMQVVDSEATFTLQAQPTLLQQRCFELLGVTPRM